MNKIRFFLIALVLAAWFCGALPALGPEGVHQHQLANGLKVLLVPRNDVPSVSLYTFFKVGSRNERVGLTGVSHFIEHMMFNGSKNVPPGEFDRTMEFMGGSNNAFTADDMTAYTDWFPPEALEAMIRQEADRMQGLLFDPPILESERGVIANERRLTTENDNQALLTEQVRATAIMAHPYHWDVIGWMSDILSWRRAEIKAYYQTYYAPNNAVLILVGDFDEAKALALVKKHYGLIPKSPSPPPVSTTEPPQLGIRRVTVRKEAQAPLLTMAFRAVNCTDKDFPALRVLASALLDGESSRLHRRLVRQEQTVLSAGGNLGENVDPFLLWIEIEPKPGADLDRIEKQVMEEIEKVCREGVRDIEVQKAVNSIKFRQATQFDTNAGIAGLLGHMELLYGDWRRAFDFTDRYQGLTAAGVKEVASRYLTPDALTVGVLVPKEEKR